MTAMSAATTSPVRSTAPAVAAGKLTLTHPTRAYAVTHNPFAVPAILPAIVLAFVALDVVIFAGVDPVVACGGFLIVTCGLLLMAAVSLRGSLTLTHDGITFERGGQHITGGWGDVTGLTYTAMSGLCLSMTGALHSGKSMHLPGGFAAEDGLVTIPLRMFGDRRYSILYDLRDALPAERYETALAQANGWSTRRSILMYGGVVAMACGAMFAGMYAVTH